MIGQISENSKSKVLFANAGEVIKLIDETECVTIAECQKSEMEKLKTKNWPLLYQMLKVYKKQWY